MWGWTMMLSKRIRGHLKIHYTEVIIGYLKIRSIEVCFI
jgi:hypothetical protein